MLKFIKRILLGEAARGTPINYPQKISEDKKTPVLPVSGMTYLEWRDGGYSKVLNGR